MYVSHRGIFFFDCKVVCHWNFAGNLDVHREEDLFVLGKMTEMYNLLGKIYSRFTAPHLLQFTISLRAFKGHWRLCQKSDSCLPGLLNELIGWCENQKTTALNQNSLCSAPHFLNFISDCNTNLGSGNIIEVQKSILHSNKYNTFQDLYNEK